MTRLTFSTTIDAPRDRIWQTLWEDATYRQWTSAFDPGSHAISDWKPGSKALFLGADGSGMVSRVAEHRPNEYLAFEHLGVVGGGVEDLDSEVARQWRGGRETYALSDADHGVLLKVDVDVADDHRQAFEEAWPKSLTIVKALSEAHDKA